MRKPKRQGRVALPVARLIDGLWCWLVFGTSEYRHEPALEQILRTGCRRDALIADATLPRIDAPDLAQLAMEM